MNTSINFTHIAPAIRLARSEGNGKAINKLICAKAGVPEIYFKTHTAQMKKLLKATATYVRVKNSPTADDATIQAAKAEIMPLWEELLSTGEAHKTVKELRCREDDIANLVGYATRFMRTANNVNFEEGFVSTLAFAETEYKAFAKAVETDLGIRMERIEVLSNEARDLLRRENSAVGGIMKARSTQEQKRSLIASLREEQAGVTSAEAKAIYERLIEKAEADIATAKEKEAEQTAILQELRSPAKPKAEKAPKTEPKTTGKGTPKGEDVAPSAPAGLPTASVEAAEVASVPAPKAVAAGVGGGKRKGKTAA